MSMIETLYKERTGASAELMKRSIEVMPGGNTRTYGYHPPYPLTFHRGKGSFLWDLDANRYIDLTYNGFTLVHGHAFEPVVRALSQALAERGSAWLGGSREQTEFAELLVDRIPGADKVRFCSSGTEAGLLAVKLARRVTGRKLILKARTGYHGSSDDLEAGLHNKGDLPGRTLLAEFADENDFERILRERGDEIAAVILEPVLIAGLRSAPREFFERVQLATRRAGTLLIFDECITFRLSPGGAQKLLGIVPDITMLGKLIGGGLPCGAVAGLDAVMGVLDPRDPRVMYHSGSYNGNLLACVAGGITLRELHDDRIAVMAAQAARIEHGLLTAAAVHGLSITVRREGSLLGVEFAGENLDTQDFRAESELARLFHLACLNHGVFVADPKELVIGLATCMSDGVVDEVIQALGLAMEDVARFGSLTRKGAHDLPTFPGR